VSIAVRLPDDEAQIAIEAGFDAIADIHRLMSFHEPDSDVSRINRAGGGTVKVDPHTYAVLAAARHVSVASNGVFDVTVAPDLVAWGFLPRPDAPDPDPAASWRDIALLPGNEIRLAKPLWVDLGGIAKGYAVDRAFAAMNLPPEVPCSVNAGGDLRVQGAGPERILLRAPAADGQVPVVELRDAALASSSGRDDARDVAGRRVGPHVEGGTHRAAGTVAFVSVVAPDCMTADALTKVVLALGAAADGILKTFDATAYFHDGQWQTLGA
jgi:FAD:protein FMN transferase